MKRVWVFIKEHYSNKMGDIARVGDVEDWDISIAKEGYLTYKDYDDSLIDRDLLKVSIVNGEIVIEEDSEKKKKYSDYKKEQIKIYRAEYGKRINAAIEIFIEEQSGLSEEQIAAILTDPTLTIFDRLIGKGQFERAMAIADSFQPNEIVTQEFIDFVKGKLTEAISKL